MSVVGVLDLSTSPGAPMPATAPSAVRSRPAKMITGASGRSASSSESIGAVGASSSSVSTSATS